MKKILLLSLACLTLAACSKQKAMYITENPEFNLYDADDSVVIQKAKPAKVEFYSWNVSDWLLRSVDYYDYEYDERNNLIKITDLDHDLDMGEDSYFITEFDYGENGLETERRYTSMNAADKGTLMYEFVYSSTASTVSIKEKIDQKLSNYKFYRFDEKNRIVEKKFYLDKKALVSSYFYDDEGRLTQMGGSKKNDPDALKVVYDNDTMTIVYDESSKITRSYSQGKLISIFEVHLNGETKYSKSDFTYDSNGRVIEVVDFNYDGVQKHSAIDTRHVYYY